MFFLIVFHIVLILVVCVEEIGKMRISENNFLCRYSSDFRNGIYVIFNFLLFGFSFKAIMKNKALLGNIRYYEQASIILSFGMIGSFSIICCKFVPDLFCKNFGLSFESCFLMTAHLFVENLILWNYVIWFKNRLRSFGALIN